MSKVTLTGNIDYIQGHLRYGHYEVEVDSEFVKNSTKEQLKQYLREKGELIVDDYEVDDVGAITKLEVTNI